MLLLAIATLTVMDQVSNLTQAQIARNPKALIVLMITRIEVVVAMIVREKVAIIMINQA